MLKEEVDAEDVAEIVAKWTGIPVSRMLEGEMEKLVHMEERVTKRVVGRTMLWSLSPMPCAAPLRASGPQPAHRFVYFSRPTGVGKTELARLWPNFS